MTDAQIRKLAELKVQQFLKEQVLKELLHNQDEKKEELFRVIKELEEIHYRKIFLRHMSQMEIDYYLRKWR